MTDSIICAGFILAFVFCLIVLAVIQYKTRAEDRAICKVAKAFPEIETYWGAKINAQNRLMEIDKEKKALRASIDERKYFPNDEQYIDILKESYYKAYLEERECEETTKEAIRQINDYEKAHFGEEKGYYWPMFFEN